MVLAHCISAIVFCVIYLIKTILILGSEEKLDRFTKVIKIPEMICAVGFLGTGIWLVVEDGGLPGWMHTKLTLVVIVIPLAIISFKKKKKALAVLSFVILCTIYSIGQYKWTPAQFFKSGVDSAIITDELDSNYDILVHGQSIYKINCSQCHGDDGKFGLSGATDLTTSYLNQEEQTKVVREGRGSTMLGYEDKLNETEIKAVMEYIQGFRK